jgi:hypothetical protein
VTTAHLASAQQGTVHRCIAPPALHCTTGLHCTALHCTALHCTALHCTALHCTAQQHCTALHCTSQLVPLSVTAPQVLLLQEGAAAGQVSTPSGAAAAAPAPLRVAPETFNVRLEELMVIDMTFLATGGGGSGAASSSSSGASDNPVLALLYEDNKGARHVRTYTLNLRTKACRASSRMFAVMWPPHTAHSP